jgi:hypothetical protein
MRRRSLAVQDPTAPSMGSGDMQSSGHPVRDRLPKGKGSRKLKVLQPLTGEAGESVEITGGKGGPKKEDPHRVGPLGAMERGK